MLSTISKSMPDSKPTSSTTKPIRTRICGPQSKNGCVTCKTRRIKCDEKWPSCIRCARSGRICEGYPQRARDNMPSPMWALTSNGAQSEHQHRLAQWGMSLLLRESFNHFGTAGVVLNVLLPQLCHSLATVNAAATTLGAVHEMQVSSSASFTSPVVVDEAFAASQYRMALRAIRHDLVTQPQGPVPLILTCFMLSVAELLLQQESNALFHIRGAFNLLQRRNSNTRLASGEVRDDVETEEPCYSEDAIDVLFRTVDFQTCSYALSKAPELSAIPLPRNLPSMVDLGSAHVVLVQLVHACYHFTSTAHTFKYQQPLSNSSGSYIEQGRYIAHLSTWLEHFTLTILPTIHHSPHSTPSQLQTYSHALTLRMTALSTLVYLSCVLTPLEIAYDSHEPHFQQIISDGQAILSTRQYRAAHDPYPVAGISGSGRFNTGPGLIQPLFLTAYKYRHPLPRRHAITLLSLAGREGPWCGPREARVTSRIMELEESHGGDSSSRRSLAEHTVRDEIVCAADIAERDRVHDMGMTPHTVGANGRRSNKIIARFSRCRDIEGWLSCPSGAGPRLDQDLNDGYWEVWTEMLKFEDSL